MSTPSNAVPEHELESQRVPPATMSATRPFYWSVRRELWENKSVYIAPLVISAVMLIAFFFSTITLPRRVRAAEHNPPRHSLSTPFDAAAGMPIAIGFIVGVFYCLDAMYGERRDRSILFWKSLPVSDRTTVLSKASIPLVVMPVIIFAVIVVTQLIMLWFSTAVLLLNGVSPTTLFSHVKLFQTQLAIIYGLIAIALWHAPIYAWMLLVSAWARRSPFLWAVLPFVSLAAIERIVFGSSHFGLFLKSRIAGWFTQAFSNADHSRNPLASLTPGNFLTTPGLWIGLAFAAAFLAAAIRLRRNREPI